MRDPNPSPHLYALSHLQLKMLVDLEGLLEEIYQRNHQGFLYVCLFVLFIGVYWVSYNKENLEIKYSIIAMQLILL